MRIILLLMLQAQEQPEPRAPGLEPRGRKPAASEWKYGLRTQAETAYDSNVWLLDDDEQERLRDHDRGGPIFSRPDADEISGRYDHMETVDDFIVNPGLRLEAKGPSPLGDELDLEAALQYSVYFENSRHNYLEFDLRLGQEVGHAGRLGLRFELIPEYFRKNYLSDATDFNGEVNPFERVFEDGTYRQWGVALDYRHKLIDRTDERPFGWTGAIELSYFDRTFDSPFTYRNKETPALRLGVGFEVGPRVKWEVHYKYSAVDSPTERIVMVRDELFFGVPLNDDNFNGVSGDPGDFVDDTDARAVQNVDRTRKEHEIGVSATVEIHPQFEVGLAYAQVRRDFESDEPFDTENNGREDTRHRIELALTYQIAKTWAAKAGYEWRRQESNQVDFESAEDGDYRKNVFTLAVSYRW